MTVDSSFLEENAPLINVAQWVPRSIVNGPGERFVLWVQGCVFRCPGCINPAFLTFEEKCPTSVAALAERVLGVKGIEGITYSGGEPMAQAQGLYYLTKRLKAAGLTAASYSGYTLEELQNHIDPFVPLLLDQLDLLIDGRYVAEQSGQLPWRGSNNQKAHFLSPAYGHLAEVSDLANREVEFIMGESQFISTGIFDLKFVRRLEEVLRESSQPDSSPLRELDQLPNQAEYSTKPRSNNALS